MEVVERNKDRPLPSPTTRESLVSLIENLEKKIVKLVKRFERSCNIKITLSILKMAVKLSGLVKYEDTCIARSLFFSSTYLQLTNLQQPI